jgi:xanthine dehydrogenase accessory factor
MNNWVMGKAQELLTQGIPFALATVVRRERPTSGEPGDKAIITAEGHFLGWVGGSCAQPAVLQEAQKALADGEPRLVMLTPDPQKEPRDGITLYQMTCYSGGTLEIYIEPYVPEPQLLVCGASPAAEAVAKIGKAVGFQVFLIDPVATAEQFPDADMVLTHIEAEKFADSRRRYAVVATMGNWDEEALKELLVLSPDYLGLVASKKRFQETTSRLRGEGIPGEKLTSITCPAGLDIAARTLQEVALSIVAEIVALRRRQFEKGEKAEARHKSADVAIPQMAVDPVCHMTVDPQIARESVNFEGVLYYFCNAHCKQSFEKDPRKYLVREVQI